MQRKAAEKRTPQYLHMATAQSSIVITFRKAQYALKRLIARFTKRVKSLSSQLKTAWETLSFISDEALWNKLRELDIPSAGNSY